MMRRLDRSAEAFPAFSDMLSCVLMFFFTMFALATMLVNVKAQAEAKNVGVQAGAMCAELTWPDGLDVDLDLWGRGENGEIIGYSNKSGRDLDLLHDTLGHYNNPGGHNYEVMCAKTLAAGQWTFNAHYYAPHQEPVPQEVPVTLILSFPSNDSKGNPKPAIKIGAVLHQVGEEITIADFELNDDWRRYTEDDEQRLSAAAIQEVITMAGTYYGFVALFVFCIATIAVMPKRYPGASSLLAIWLVLLSAVVGYVTVDNLLGTPKPVVSFALWHGPDWGKDGVIVAGGIVAPESVYLLIKEDDRAAPRLFAFPADHEFIRQLKQTMTAAGKAHGGFQWGFRVKLGQHAHKGAAANSGDDRESPYEFEDPQAEVLPPKDVPPPASEFRAPQDAPAP